MRIEEQMSGKGVVAEVKQIDWEVKKMKDQNGEEEDLNSIPGADQYYMYFVPVIFSLLGFL